MDSILKRLQEPKAFQAFIEESMKTSTYRPLWKDEITQIDYCAAKVYQSTIADYAAAIVGSVIDKNGEKPVHQMPTVAELTGSIGHMGDEWELDNEYSFGRLVRSEVSGVSYGYLFPGEDGVEVEWNDEPVEWENVNEYEY